MSKHFRGLFAVTAVAAGVTLGSSVNPKPAAADTCPMTLCSDSTGQCFQTFYFWYCQWSGLSCMTLQCDTSGGGGSGGNCNPSTPCLPTGH